MKIMIATLFALILGMIAPVEDVWAGKRLGGGSSLGMQRNVTPAPKAAPSQQASAPAAPAAAAATQAGKRSWLGPIAGIAGAIGLAALLSHLGLGEEAASFLLMLLVVVVGFVVVRWFMSRNRRTEERMSYAAAGPVGAPRPQFEPPAAPAGAPLNAGASQPLPDDMNLGTFVRLAKVNFTRLQNANDTANLDDIREFTTPEMYAEIALQIEERGGTTQHTEVVNLEADILEFAEEGDRQILSVRFHGMIRDEEGAEPVPFDEAWHLVRPRDLSRHWLIAGIQQIS